MTDLRPVIAQAIAELDAEHYESQVGGCSVCLPSRSWPCITRQVADDLRGAMARTRHSTGAALGEGSVMERIGWMHPNWSSTRLLSDGQRKRLEDRAPTDPTYVTGFVAVYRAALGEES